jgi:hypothetical protein
MLPSSNSDFEQTRQKKLFRFEKIYADIAVRLSSKKKVQNLKEMW